MPSRMEHTPPELLLKVYSRLCLRDVASAAASCRHMAVPLFPFWMMHVRARLDAWLPRRPAVRKVVEGSTEELGVLLGRMRVSHVIHRGKHTVVAELRLDNWIVWSAYMFDDLAWRTWWGMLSKDILDSTAIRRPGSHGPYDLPDDAEVCRARASWPDNSCSMPTISAANSHS